MPSFSLRTVFTLATLALAATSVSAAWGDAVTYEFVTCEFRASGSWAGCSIIPHEYIPFRGYERTVTFNYVFTCSPGDAGRYSIGVKTRDAWLPFAFGKSGTVSLDTVHAIALTNESSTSFYRANFNPGCSLVVETSESGPTTRQVDAWRSESTRQDAILTQEKTLQVQLKTLSTLNAGFDILMSLVANLDASLRQQNDLITRVKSGEVTKSLSEIADNTQDAAKAKALRALVKEIERIRVDDTTEDVLSRSLSPDDLSLVRSVTKPDPDEIRVNIDASIVRETAADQALWGVCYNGAKFVDLPPCLARYPDVEWKDIP